MFMSSMIARAYSAPGQAASALHATDMHEGSPSADAETVLGDLFNPRCIEGYGAGIGRAMSTLVVQERCPGALPMA